MAEHEHDFDGDHDDFDDDVDEELEEEGVQIMEEDMADENTGRGHFKVAQDDRITSKFMTKYEKARVLGTRAL